MRLLVLGQFEIHRYAHHWQGIRDALAKEDRKTTGRIADVACWDPRKRCAAKTDPRGLLRYQVDLFEKFLEDIRAYGPDVVLCCSADSFSPKLRETAKDLGAFLALWFCDIREPQPMDLAGQVDLIMLSAGGMVPKYTAAWNLEPDQGIWMPQACLPREPGFYCAPKERFARDGIFIGSAAGNEWHNGRRQVLQTARQKIGDRFRWLDPHTDSEKAIVTAKLPELYQNTRVALGHSYPDCTGYHSNRIFLATGNGGFYFTNDFPGLGDLFEPGTEVATYTPSCSAESIVSHLQMWIHNTPEANTIRWNGYRRAQTDHTYPVRMHQILTEIEERR